MGRNHLGESWAFGPAPRPFMNEKKVYVPLIAALTAMFLILGTSLAFASVWTDATGYAPGSTVGIFGDGMAPFEPVRVEVFFPDGSPAQSHEVAADVDGNFFDAYALPGPEAPVTGEYRV